jgi:hypothetical protein
VGPVARRLAWFDVATLLVTLDTSALKHMAVITAALADVDHDLRTTTVTGRESPSRVTQLGLGGPVPESAVWNETRWNEGVYATAGPMIGEPFVLDESRVGSGVQVTGDGDQRSLLEEILAIIDSGFPKPGRRDNLSPGHRNQLRDAMILDAHACERRHLFITADKAAFVNGGRRERHEALCRTRIAIPDEVADMIATPWW